MDPSDILDDPHALDAEVKRYRKYLKKRAKKVRKAQRDAIARYERRAGTLAVFGSGAVYSYRVPTYRDWRHAAESTREQAVARRAEADAWRTLATQTAMRCGTVNMPNPPTLLLDSEGAVTPAEFWDALVRDSLYADD